MSKKVQIIKIKEIDTIKKAGYGIITNYKTKYVYAEILGEQICCERYGAYLYLNNKLIETINLPDAIDQVKDAEIMDIVIEPPMTNGGKFDEENEINVVINTSKGTLKIKLYNQHNGYYPHAISININGKITNTRL